MAAVLQAGAPPRLPPARNSLAAAFERLTRPQLALIAETAIEQMDLRDGDCDLEEDDPSFDILDIGQEDHARHLPKPVYGDDQSLGPINEMDAFRADHAWKMAS